MQKLKVSQVAAMVGASVATVYRRINSCETVKSHLIKEKGCLFLDEEGIEILKKSFQKEEQQTPPGETEYFKTIIAQQQGMIQDLLARQAEERQRSDTIIMKISNDLGSMRTLLEETRKPLLLLNEPVKAISPWRPEKPKDPLAEMNWLQRVWVKIFEPWKMRRYTL